MNRPIVIYSYSTLFSKKIALALLALDQMPIHQAQANPKVVQSCSAIDHSISKGCSERKVCER